MKISLLEWKYHFGHTWNMKMSISGLLFCSGSPYSMRSKVVLIWEPEWRHDFNVFPAKFWIFKFFFLMIFAIKMLLDNIYGLLNLFEFKINHFNSLVQAKSEFKNSNFGGKYIEIMSSLMFSNKYDFKYEFVIRYILE